MEEGLSDFIGVQRVVFNISRVGETLNGPGKYCRGADDLNKIYEQGSDQIFVVRSVQKDSGLTPLHPQELIIDAQGGPLTISAYWFLPA